MKHFDYQPDSSSRGNEICHDITKSVTTASEEVSIGIYYSAIKQADGFQSLNLVVTESSSSLSQDSVVRIASFSVLSTHSRSMSTDSDGSAKIVCYSRVRQYFDIWDLGSYTSLTCVTKERNTTYVYVASAMMCQGE